MESQIDEIKLLINKFAAKNISDVEKFRISLLGKKGKITSLFKNLRSFPPEQKRKFGQLINEIKNKAAEKIHSSKQQFESENIKQSGIDVTRTAIPIPLGSRHPVSSVKNQIIDIFSRIGFVVIEGPEIEDDWHVFTALNFPEEHPARDMQDTFFIQHDPDILLRTHTSSVQVRVMENTKPPIRTINPGRVFRNEAISARAHCIFHQVEGLYIDTEVSFADLKQTLVFFAKEMFGHDTKTRLRASYFPFTEPSAEMDISCTLCAGKGCNVCKYTGWVEILGCGMVDPNVLENNKINSEKYTGFAFGMGIERIAMLKYKISDIRLFFNNDIRFLSQFTSA